jgi:NADPH:quinone reductase-like Zn-dependent oxidoreductase
MKFILPEKMTAVQIDMVTGKLITRIVSVPKPSKGEVLIKMAAAPINPSDIARIKSIMESENSPVFIPGIEGSGRVVAAGKGLLPSLFLGRRVGCSSAYETSGTYAEYMLTKATLCFPLPKGISDEQGSMLLVNPMTALAFFDIVKKNKHKAIISTAAAGALGRMIDFLGEKYNVPVINIVRKEEQLIHLLEQGSKYVLNSSSENFSKKLHTLAHELNATVVLDAVGGKGTSHLINALPYGGSLIIYGSLSGEQPELNFRVLVGENKTISGFYLVNWSKDNGLFKTIRNVIRVRKLLKDDIKIQIQARFTLDKAQEAMDVYLSNMTAGKVLLGP